LCDRAFADPATLPIKGPVATSGAERLTLVADWGFKPGPAFGIAAHMTQCRFRKLRHSFCSLPRESCPAEIISPHNFTVASFGRFDFENEPMEQVGALGIRQVADGLLDLGQD
jgi:hypothetical protein